MTPAQLTPAQLTPARVMVASRMVLARMVLGGVLVALAGLSFSPVFRPVVDPMVGSLAGQGANGFPGPPALLLAVLVPVAVALAWGLLTCLVGRPPGGALSALGVVLVLAAVAVITRPGAQVAAGPRRLLTSALPVEAAGPELAAVSALTGFAALVAVRLVLVSRSGLAPLLPALACLVAGLALGATTGRLPSWYPVAFFVLAVGLLVSARPAGQGRGPSGRSLLGAGVMLLVAVVAVPLLSPVLPGADRDPADVRNLVAVPVAPKERINPFARYVALREGRLPLEITGLASAPFERLRMVTLTDFDGRSWSVRADYRRAGHQLPAPAERNVETDVVEMDVTVRNPQALGWLPTPGRAQQVSVAGLGVHEQTGDVVIPDRGAHPRAVPRRRGRAGPDDAGAARRRARPVCPAVRAPAAPRRAGIRRDGDGGRPRRLPPVLRALQPADAGAVRHRHLRRRTRRARVLRYLRTAAGPARHQ